MVDLVGMQPIDVRPQSGPELPPGRVEHEPFSVHPSWCAVVLPRSAAPELVDVFGASRLGFTGTHQETSEGQGRTGRVDSW